jgi:hypothetical protein
MGAAISPVIGDITIYNNLFRIETEIDPYPEYIRIYGTSLAPMTSLHRFHVFNNTFADNPGNVMYYSYWYNADFVGSLQFKNNLFINCSTRVSSFLCNVEDWALFDNDAEFASNLYYNTAGSGLIVFRGTNYTTAEWIAAGVETGGTLSQPQFESYTANASDNNFRLSAADTAARGQGANLSGIFTTDFAGTPRPSTGAWTIGAYEYVPGGPRTTRAAAARVGSIQFR